METFVIFREWNEQISIFSQRTAELCGACLRQPTETTKDLSLLLCLFVFSTVWDSSEPFRGRVVGTHVPLRDCWKLDWCLSIVLLSVSPANNCVFINFPVSCGRISDLHLLHYCIEQLSSRDVGGLWWPWGCSVSTLLSCHIHLITSAV